MKDLIVYWLGQNCHERNYGYRSWPLLQQMWYSNCNSGTCLMWSPLGQIFPGYHRSRLSCACA